MPRTSRKRSETGFYHVILRGNGKQNLFETDKDRAAFMEAARSSFSRDSVRTSRKRSETGFYHVILRGNGKQNLFETDKDRAAFMEAARSSFSRDSVTLIAWCLMDNHVHLIIDDPLDRISTAIQRVTSTYARYFNHSFGHSGHVFEGRYGSVPIIDDEQLLAAVKYVHNNPLKGMGITPDRYPWCSYSEYVSGVSTTHSDTQATCSKGATEAFPLLMTSSCLQR